MGIIRINTPKVMEYDLANESYFLSGLINPSGIERCLSGRILRCRFSVQTERSTHKDLDRTATLVRVRIKQPHNTPGTVTTTGVMWSAVFLFFQRSLTRCDQSVARHPPRGNWFPMYTSKYWEIGVGPPACCPITPPQIRIRQYSKRTAPLFDS